MKIKLNLNRITSESLIIYSVALFFLLTCLPITMCIPGIIRKILQIIAMLLLVGGLLICNNKNYFILFSLIFVVMTFRIYTVWHFQQSFSSCAFSVFAGCAFAVTGIMLYKQINDYRISMLLFFVVIIALITSITTIIGVIDNPLAVRELGRSGMGYGGVTGDEFQQLKFNYRLQNIAGWNHLYGIVFLLPCLIEAYKMHRKIIYLFTTISCFICIFMSQIGFAIVIALFILLCMFVRMCLKSKLIVLLGVIVGVGILFIINLDYFMSMLIDYTFSHKMLAIYYRLLDVNNLLNGMMSGDVLARADLYSKSLDLFAEHPVLGQVFYGVSKDGLFSRHSEFFDMIAFWGIIGIIMLVVIISLYCRYIKKYNKYTKTVSYIVFAGFLLMYIVNPIWYSPQIAISVFLIPAILSNMCMQKEKSIEKKVNFNKGYHRDIDKRCEV